MFGEPSERESWGWQLQGHHIDLHCLFLGGQVVITSSFFGCEFGGDEVFREHLDRAWELMDSLAVGLRDKALLYGSMPRADLPPELGGPVDDPHNLVLPCEDLADDVLGRGRREVLMSLVDVCPEGLPDKPRAHRRAQDRANRSTTGCTAP